jgi:hypothetical protein
MVNISQHKGGGIYCDNSSPLINECILVGNESVSSGGAIACEFYSAPEISNCMLIRNESATGGGVYCFRSSPLISGSTLYGNRAHNAGGGIALALNSYPEITTTIITESAEGEALKCIDGSSQPVVSCSDIFGNAGGDWTGCIAEYEGVNGNFSLDPYFCNELDDDFHLAGISPCLPGNNDCSQQIGALGFGCDEPTAVDEETEEEKLPQEFALSQNYPNPFNPSTMIKFSLPVRSYVNLSIFNVLGQKVVTVADDIFEAGYHTVNWDGQDSNGRQVSSGIYIYRIQADTFADSRKMLLIK